MFGTAIMERHQYLIAPPDDVCGDIGNFFSTESHRHKDRKGYMASPGSCAGAARRS